jgi:hypothetical protein
LKIFIIVFLAIGLAWTVNAGCGGSETQVEQQTDLPDIDPDADASIAIGNSVSKIIADSLGYAVADDFSISKSVVPISASGACEDGGSFSEDGGLIEGEIDIKYLWTKIAMTDCEEYGHTTNGLFYVAALYHDTIPEGGGNTSDQEIFISILGETGNAVEDSEGVTSELTYSTMVSRVVGGVMTSVDLTSSRKISGGIYTTCTADEEGNVPCSVTSVPTLPCGWSEDGEICVADADCASTGGHETAYGDENYDGLRYCFKGANASEDDRGCCVPGYKEMNNCLNDYDIMRFPTCTTNEDCSPGTFCDLSGICRVTFCMDDSDCIGDSKCYGVAKAMPDELSRPAPRPFVESTFGFDFLDDQEDIVLDAGICMCNPPGEVCWDATKNGTVSTDNDMDGLANCDDPKCDTHFVCRCDIGASCTSAGEWWNVDVEVDSDGVVLSGGDEACALQGDFRGQIWDCDEQIDCCNLAQECLLTLNDSPASCLSEDACLLQPGDVDLGWNCISGCCRDSGCGDHYSCTAANLMDSVDGCAGVDPGTDCAQDIGARDDGTDLGISPDCCVAEIVVPPEDFDPADCPHYPYGIPHACEYADAPNVPGGWGGFPSHPIISQMVDEYAYNGCDASGVTEFINTYDFGTGGDTLRALKKDISPWPMSCSNNGCCLDNYCGEETSCEGALITYKQVLLITGVHTPSTLPVDIDIDLDEACQNSKGSDYKCDLNHGGTSGCCIFVPESD